MYEYDVSATDHDRFGTSIYVVPGACIRAAVQTYGFMRAARLAVYTHGATAVSRRGSSD